MTNEKKKGSEKKAIKKITTVQKPTAPRRKTGSAQPVLENYKTPARRKNTVTGTNTSADTSGDLRSALQTKLRAKGRK